MRRRILHVITSLDGGGAERVLVTVMAGLPEWEHHLACAKGGSLLPLVPSGVVVHPAGTEAELLALMDECRPDVVHTWHGGSLLEASLPAAYLGVPLVHRLYNVASVQEPFEAFVREQRQRTSWALNAASAVVALSSVSAEDAVRFYGIERPQVINNGFPLARIGSAHTAAEIRSGTNLVVLAIGRLASEKGHAVLIEAVGRIAAQHREFELWIAGVGHLEDELRAQAAACGVADRVKFLGFREDVESLYARADVFVCPSLAEGFGNAVAEAVIAGLPIVASDLPEFRRDILEDAPAAKLVPRGDAAALAAALAELLTDSNARLALSREALRASRRLSVSHMLDGYRNLYQRLVTRECAIV